MTVGAQYLGAGIFHYPAETDPVRIQQAAAEFDQWKNLFSKVKEASDRHGWESRECREARIQYKQWQERRLAACV